MTLCLSKDCKNSSEDQSKYHDHTIDADDRQADMCAIYYNQKDVDGYCQKGEYDTYVEESKDQADARARVEGHSACLGIGYLRKFL